MAAKTKEKQIITKAINDLGRKVTVADVATKTGLPLSITTSELNKIAAETNGHLTVNSAGIITYGFDFGFQNAYLAKGTTRMLHQIASLLFSAGYYLLRISFGIMLVISFVIVLLLVIGVIIFMSRGSSQDDDRGFGFDLFDYLILRDLFYWGTYSTTQIDYNKPTTRTQRRDNFLLNCFSFLFGDGNPNLHLDERRWQLISQAIKFNNGTITAEQIAPYTGTDPKNEDGVLPVLVRFDGQPEVTEKGNIIYLFPSLQVSASQTENKQNQPPKLLQEYPWQFSHLSIDSMIPIYILAGFNCIGSWWLFNTAFQVPFLLELMPLLTVLVIYGTLFVLVPLIRWLALKWLNKQIANRNEKREGYAKAVINPKPQLAQKLKEAEKLMIKQTNITPGDIAYTTNKDILEQEFDRSS